MIRLKRTSINGIFLLSMAVLALTVISLASNVSAAQAIWFAGFESGTQSDFNLGHNQNYGTLLSVSNVLVYDGKYSGYYYYLVSPTGGSLRVYPTEMLSSPLTSFLIQVWVYVPSSVKGSPVSLTDWVSFISAWLNKGGSSAGINPITVDSNTQGQLQLWVGMLPNSQRLVLQKSPVQWPLNKWFKIGLQAQIGNKGTKITLYQDDVAIISFTGNLGRQITGLTQMHYGLYAGANQGIYAVLNDDISVQRI